MSGPLTLPIAGLPWLIFVSFCDHTTDKFGPVRVVEPQLVFELVFENLQVSKRHKSGIAVRFPRIARWRTDKTPAEADSLETIRGLLEQANS